MDLKKGNKVKIYNCEDIFNIDEVEENRVKITKIRTLNNAWINRNRIEKIIKEKGGINEKK